MMRSVKVSIDVAPQEGSQPRSDPPSLEPYPGGTDRADVGRVVHEIFSFLSNTFTNCMHTLV